MLCFCTFLTILEHFGTKAFKKPVAPAGYKNKQTVSRRRYLARVLSSLMYRYALRQSASVPRFLYPAKGYGIISLTFKLRMILCQELFCVSNAVSVQRELFPIAHNDFTESQLLHVSAVEDGPNGRGKEGGMIFYLGE